MINCKSCGHEIAKNAKVCPNCGAKNKKPIYKRPWIYIVAVFVLIVALSAGGSDPVDYSNISYEPVAMTDLFDALDANALKAEGDYSDKYIEISGYIATIDSDGSYISIDMGDEDEDWEYLFQSIHCSLTSDEQKDAIMSMSQGDKITIRGQITDIGEVLGYYMDIHSIQ